MIRPIAINSTTNNVDESHRLSFAFIYTNLHVGTACRGR